MNSINYSLINFGNGSWVLLLTLVFVILKLTHTISWGWFWVLSPLIFTLGLVLFVLLVVGLILLSINFKGG